METMKRAISFFMALVLVLGMVPASALSAAAEEVETLPETVAEETTEAPAETEAEEVAAETEAETLPEETVAAETVCEETVLVEVLPEELPAEAELYAEEDPEEDDPGEPVAATGITLKASTERTYVGEEVKLTVSLEPKEADQNAFELEVLEGDVEFVEDDVIIANAPGLVKIRAVCVGEDGEPVLDAEDKEIEDTVEITFVDVRVQFNLLPIDEDYVVGENAIRLTSGQELEVSLKYQTNETGADEDWKTEYILTPNVEWSFDPAESEAFASLTVDAVNESIAILRADVVTAPKQFTLKAVDAIAGEAELAVEICPAAEDLEIWLEGGNVSGETITIDLGKIERRDEEILIPMMAKLFPEGSVSKIRWETSSDMVAGVELVSDSSEGPVALADGEEDEEPDGIYVIVHVGGERLEGEATLTATCKDDPTIKATVTIKTVDCLQVDEIDWHSDTKKVEYLISGKSVKLKALDITDPDNKKLLTSEQVEWSLGEEDYAYASISQDGMLAARSDIAMGRAVTVYCRVIGNEEEGCLEKTVRIHPKAQAVHVLDEEGVEYTGETIYMKTAGAEKPERFNLYFWVEPGNHEMAEAVSVMPLYGEDDLGALQEVTWKSSNTSIAKIGSKTGEVRWQGKNGTVTITATAADGSGKSASVKIKFGTFASEVAIDCPLDYVRSGESVVMKYSTDAPGAKLTWSLGEGDEQYASISSGGKLTVKSIYEERTISVTAVAEGTGASATAYVDIKPVKDGILTLYADGECVTKTTQKLDVATERIELTACIVGEGTEDVRWTYPSSVECYDYGNGTAAFAMKKTGTATVKATSLATGKTATITLKGIRKAETVEIIVKDEMDLAAGQSMTLKAKLYDAEGKTPSSTAVSWSVEGEGAEFVSITSGGKITVSKDYKGNPTDVTVCARATDGSDAEDSCTVTIRPKTTGVMIRYDGISRVTLAYEIAQAGDEEFQLEALTYPRNQAREDVKWSSSNTKIATVDADGYVTCNGTGTVTIKATAKDGSGKYASLKLTITKPVSEILFEDDAYVLAGGKSLTLKPEILAADGKKPSNSAVTWSISGDTAYVSSFKNGVLKTKKVTEYKEVTITAIAKDGSETSGSCTVGIYPATTSVQILEGGEKVGIRTLYMCVGDTLGLDAVSYPDSDDIRAAQEWTWSTSSKTYATVSEDGVVEALKAGTVTIKATAKDGTGKYDTVKIKILK